MSLGKYLGGYHDVECQMAEDIRSKASEFFAREDAVKKGIGSREAFEQRKAHIKKTFLDAIGGLDIERTPLNVTYTGIVEKNGYAVKKVIFQSQPGVYVTSNLYIPDGLRDKAPAVLFACGHFESAKAAEEYQKVCIDLVNNGFVVLIPDPIGQGERMQYYDHKSGRPLVYWGVTEHSYAGLQCSLTGSGIARYFIWDLVRAVDFLCSLPEVDAGKIGITGNSGGGMQTAYMMLADERIAAAIPCTWITSREAFLKNGLPQDSEQNIFGAIAEGFNYDDFIACFAPKPAMLGTVESDFFPMEGVVQTFDRAARVYSLYGCRENVELCVTKGLHHYNDDLRQAAVNWFSKHLKGTESNFVTDSGMAAEKPELLQCTEIGQVMAEFPDACSVYDLNVAYLERHKYENTTDEGIVRENILKILNLPAKRQKIYPRYLSETNSGSIYYENDSVVYKDVFFFSEENVAVDGVYIEMAGRKSERCTVLLLDEGTGKYSNEADLIRRFLKQGDVFVFEPRGVGALESRPVNSRPLYDMFGTEYKLNIDAMSMKMSLTGLRVFDVLRAIDYVTEIQGKIKVGLAGKEISALYALLSAAVSDHVDEVYLENMIPSFEALVRTKYFKFDVRYEIYGVLKMFDIPQIVEAFKHSRRITLAGTPDIGKYVGTRSF